MSFRCGHPKEPGNIYVRPDGHPTCSFCRRAHTIVQRVKREQLRINEGRFYSLGERICRGLA